MTYFCFPICSVSKLRCDGSRVEELESTSFVALKATRMSAYHSGEGVFDCVAGEVCVGDRGRREG